MLIRDFGNDPFLIHYPNRTHNLNPKLTNDNLE